MVTEDKVHEIVVGYMPKNSRRLAGQPHVHPPAALGTHTRLHAMGDVLDHSGSISSGQHGTLGDLHPGYFLADGTRAMTGDIRLAAVGSIEDSGGTNRITLQAAAPHGRLAGEWLLATSGGAVLGDTLDIGDISQAHDVSTGRFRIGTWKDSGVGLCNMFQVDLTGTQTAPAGARIGFSFLGDYNLNGHALIAFVGMNVAPGITGAGVLDSYSSIRAATLGATTDNILSSDMFQAEAPGFGWNATNHAGFRVINQGLGTLDKSAALWVHSQSGSVLTLSLYVQGTAQSRHVPAITFGADTAPGFLRTVDVQGKLYTSGETEIDGALNHDGTTVGFYGVAPVARPAAYTQTYATADKTHAAFTSADIAAFTGGTVGFLDAAERDNIRTQFNALRADVADVKQLANSIIDDLQAEGLLQ